MLVKTKAIVISSIKYRETSLIVKCLTNSDGVKTYFVPNVFGGKKSNKTAFFQPLTQLDIVAYHKNKGTLERFKEFSVSNPYQSISGSMTKTALVLFLSELLHNALKEEGRNDALFTFLEAALLWLDHHSEVANFHLITALHITKYLGFFPHSENDFPHFDLAEGLFTDEISNQCITAEETDLFRKLLQLKFDNSEKVFSAVQRRILLKILMDYYALNIAGFEKPKSLAVFREIF